MRVCVRAYQRTAHSLLSAAPHPRDPVLSTHQKNEESKAEEEVDGLPDVVRRDEGDQYCCDSEERHRAPRRRWVTPELGRERERERRGGRREEISLTEDATHTPSRQHCQHDSQSDS